MIMILANPLYYNNENLFPRTPSGGNAATRSQPFFDSLKIQILGYTAGIVCRTLHNNPRHRSLTGARIETYYVYNALWVVNIAPSRGRGLKLAKAIIEQEAKASLPHGGAD